MKEVEGVVFELLELLNKKGFKNCLIEWGKTEHPNKERATQYELLITIEKNELDK